MNLEASASCARRLYYLFKGVQSFLTYVTIQYDDDGLSFQGMDPSHVCLIIAHIAPSEFSAYTLKGDGCGSFGIRIATLVNILRHSTAGDRLVVSHSPDSIQQACVVSLKGDSRDISVPIPLMDIDEDELGVPDIDYGFQMEFIPKDWDTHMKPFEVIEAYNVTLMPSSKDTEKDVFRIRGEGDVAPMDLAIRAGADTNAATPRILATPPTPMAPVTLSYPMVTAMRGLSRATTKLTLCLEDGVPALFKYTYGEGIRVDLHLAPKLTDD